MLNPLLIELAVKFCINPDCEDRYYRLYIEKRRLGDGEYWTIRNDYGNYLCLKTFSLKSLSSAEVNTEYRHQSLLSALNQIESNYSLDKHKLYKLDSRLFSTKLLS